MNIKPISIQYYSKNTVKQNSSLASNPMCSQKNNSNKLKYPISFCGLIANSDLLKSGYKVAQINNNKISNQEDSIIITSADKFLALQNSPSTWNKKIVLTNDIDLNGVEIKSIGNASKPFKGEFDGNGCKISNFKINNPEGRNIGLFGKCENAKILNLEVENAFIKGKQQVGGIAGYANNSSFENSSFCGYIDGEKKLGGLVGLSKQNNIINCNSAGTVKVNNVSDIDDMFGINNQSFSNGGIAGGLIGADEESNISNSYSISTVFANEQVGGLIGYAERSIIQDCCYKGKIIGNNKTGGLIGWGAGSNIFTSYSISNRNNLVGENSSTFISKSYFNLEDITTKPSAYWNSNVWNLNRGRLPRLNAQVKNMTKEQLYLEDLNIDIKTGNVFKMRQFDNKIQEEIKINLAPSKHYGENNELLEKIKNSKDNRFLRFTFSELVAKIHRQGLLGKNSTDKYDELLTALVQNKNMDINSTYEHGTDDLEDEYGLDGRAYNVWCSPLFVLTCMNKSYALKEALKRDDADFVVGSGFGHNETILNQAFEHHIDSCAYVLLTEPKMQDYIDEKLNKLKANNPSALGKLLLECFPDNIPPYNEKKGCIEFSQEFDYPKELLEPISEIQNLEEAQKQGIFDANYKDSLGSNIVNVAATLQKAEDALRILLAAKRIGTDINNWNKKSESPIGHGIYTNKPHFVAQILDGTNTPFIRIADGTDSMLLFSNMPNEKYSINYMDIAKKRGLSVNTSDNNGNTPLINAIKLKHHDAIKYLLSNGVSPNQPDNAKQTPLHHACLVGDIETINILLDSYAYPNVKDLLESLPFDYLDEDAKALISEKLEGQRILYQTSGLLDNILPSAENCNLDNYDSLYSLNETSQRILDGNKADKDILQLTKNLVLNQQMTSITDDSGNSVLHLVARSTSLYAKECLKASIENGVDINRTNKNKETALMSAVESYLGADSTEEKITLMQNIKFLLDNKPNVDLVDNNEQSVLHRICQSGNLILFNEILKLNPKINQLDKKGKTPFEYIPKIANEPMYITAKEYLKNNKIIKGEQ